MDAVADTRIRGGYIPRNSLRRADVEFRTTAAVAESSIDLAQVLVKPSQYLPYQVGPLFRDIMRSIEQDRLLVGWPRAKTSNQRIFTQENPVELARD